MAKPSINGGAACVLVLLLLAAGHGAEQMVTQRSDGTDGTTVATSEPPLAAASPNAAAQADKACRNYLDALDARGHMLGDIDPLSADVDLTRAGAYLRASAPIAAQLLDNLRALRPTTTSERTEIDGLLTALSAEQANARTRVAAAAADDFSEFTSATHGARRLAKLRVEAANHLGSTACDLG